jgi:hypothetical protein
LLAGTSIPNQNLIIILTHNTVLSRLMDGDIALYHDIYRIKPRESASLRRHFPYIYGRIILTLRQSTGTSLRGEVRHKTGELHQVHQPQERSPLSYDDFRILGDNVGPLRRNGANGPVVDAQQ